MTTEQSTERDDTERWYEQRQHDTERARDAGQGDTGSHGLPHMPRPPRQAPRDPVVPAAGQRGVSTDG